MISLPRTSSFLPSNSVPTLISIFVSITLACAMALYVHRYRKKRARLIELMDKIPGPPALPIIGNTLQINVEHDELFQRLQAATLMYGRRIGMARSWLAKLPYVFITDPKLVEIILSSNKHIDKSPDYDYLHPWLGTGLLTSAGKKWHSRRKILTPAFHFRILDDFIDVFWEQSQVLVSKLEKEAKTGAAFDLFPYITLCTLDIICETAMGRTVNAQSNSESEYVKAIYKISTIIQNRQAKIWLQPDWLFKLTKHYGEHERCIQILHNFSNKVIKERKEELQKLKGNEIQKEDEESLFMGRKKRLAFLDLLIEASQGGTVLSNEDIREEVDTFMFEGHDTTSAATSWVLFLLGCNPDIQDKVMEELDGIFGDDDRKIKMKDLQDMQYLECCIKDALRLYPSVPLIARQLKEDAEIAGYTVPAGTTTLIVTYMLHRNPKIWPTPEKFNPDNFLPENCQGRNPYAYIPFSAGPRNCIGKKFAMLEEKALVSSVLRKYRVKAVDRREDLTLLGELILRPKNGLRIQLFPRKTA
ncbi:cytochrome P450 4c3 isoform X2 [Ischnura elegans]|uniref:cytochrome P450 4c3 isoform X2 n=1 Tax=Ischnura elegans TaxID=197161 RepID=UPI001ED89520|nr:cytochrome P450 4c3 isoform X2 [Ischnura elegans]